MANVNIIMRYSLQLDPAEFKMILKALEGGEFTEEEGKAARELAIKMRQQRQSQAQNVIGMM